MTKRIAALLVALGLAFAAPAQTTTFTYQGQLLVSGSPHSGLAEFQFTVWDAASGGTQLAATSPAIAAVTATNGLFTASLDFGAAAFTGADRWLDVQVRTGLGAFTPLTTRQMITATPYAITAGNVSGVLSSASLPANPTFSGTVEAAAFTGGGANLTSLNASQMVTGTVPSAALDNAWKIGGNAGLTAGSQFLGTTDNEPVELKVNGLRVTRWERPPDAVIFGRVLPNLIAGYESNSVTSGIGGATIAGGGGPEWYGPTLPHTISGTFGTIGGGVGNVVSAPVGVIAGGERGLISSNAYNSFIGGGAWNSIDAPDSVIAGGRNNTNRTGSSVIGGGYGNIISNYSSYSVIGGGGLNAIGNSSAVIGGGQQNRVTGNNGTIGGGGNNTVGGPYATVAGGNANLAGGLLSTVPGGSGNRATGDYSFAAGRSAWATHEGSFVWSDPSSSLVFLSTSTNQFLIRAASGVGINTNNPAGAALSVAGTVRASSFEGSGSGLTALNASSLTGSVPPAALTSVPAGNLTGTVADARLSANVALLGSSQTFTGLKTFGNEVRIGVSSGDYRRLILGGGNSDGFLYGSWPALGDGIHLAYNHFYNSGGGSQVINAGGQTARLSVGYGTVGIYVGGVNAAPATQRLLATTTGVTVNGTFNNQSDRASKQDFKSIDPAHTLDQVLELPITEWSYKEDPQTRHLGPVAQDFHATFGLGTDEKHIAPMDQAAVALAAIQGLNQKVEAQRATLEQKETAIAELKARLDRLEQLLK